MCFNTARKTGMESFPSTSLRLTGSLRRTKIALIFRSTGDGGCVSYLSLGPHKTQNTCSKQLQESFGLTVRGQRPSAGGHSGAQCVCSHCDRRQEAERGDFQCSTFFMFSLNQTSLEMPSQPCPKVGLLRDSKQVKLSLKINQGPGMGEGESEELISTYLKMTRISAVSPKDCRVTLDPGLRSHQGMYSAFPTAGEARSSPNIQPTNWSTPPPTRNDAKVWLSPSFLLGQGPDSCI